MQTIRKDGSWTLLPAALACLLLMGTGSCKNEARKKVKPGKQEETYEPKFRKDGDLWLIKAATGDTLMRLDVEYANTASSIEYGMMYRKSMDETMSMLFFMGNMQMRSFWMKNTYVSLDIIYVDDRYRIVSIQKNAEPLNTSSLPSEGPAMYVLEVKGGLSDKLGLRKGDMITWQDAKADES
jgi:uncharacterized membrane protein (UPF0127 family)